MKSYRDTDKDSGISAYEYDQSSIKIQFKGGSIYEYTYSSAGSSNIENMKRLADKDDGLNAFINLHVKKKYSRKIR